MTAARALRRSLRTYRVHQHRLSTSDQTGLALLDATDRNQLIQAVWWYERGVDLNGLSRFVDAFTAGPGNRLIERSRIPGACSRWVRPSKAPRMHVGTGTRARGELMSWADSCASRPIHPVDGPSWRLDVQSFDDGSAAVCFTASHVIGDAFGAFMILRQAMAGSGANPGYEVGGSRSAWTGAVSDLASALLGLPAAVRALALVARLLRQHARSRTVATPAPASPPQADDGDVVRIPSVVLKVDLDEWNACAHDRGGNSATLLMAFTARLAGRVGHTRPDGRVTLLVPVSTREGPEDLRALAFRFGRTTLDPTSVFGDHRSLRDALQETRMTAAEGQDARFELFALLPWLSRRAVRRFVNLLFAYSDDAPVSLSNLGVLPSELGRVDGSEADWFIARPIDTNVRTGELRRTNGHLVVVAAALRATERKRRVWSIAVEGYEVGADNSGAHLGRMVCAALGDLGLSGTVETPGDAHGDCARCGSP